MLAEIGARFMQVLVGMTKWGIDYTFDCVYAAACLFRFAGWAQMGCCAIVPLKSFALAALAALLCDPRPGTGNTEVMRAALE